MKSHALDAVVGRTRAAAQFFSRDVWEARLDELPGAKAVRYQSARMLHAAVHGLFLEERHQIRAAALTYFTVLSIVPLLAFVFALLKGFGAYDLLIDDTIRPYVVGALSGNAPLQSAFEQILGFVDNTGVTSLGLVGLLALLYAATRLLRNIEVALNAIWGVDSARGPFEQVRDYLALIVIIPICLMVAAALTTAGQALSMLRAAGELFGLSAIVDPLIGILGPLVVLFGGLTVLYMVMPHTRVNVRSAIVGAIVGAVGWYALLVVHVKFQVGVARFNALYSSFGAIPIFLAWLQISWVVILVGAQVAATHQQTQAIAQHKRLPHVAQAQREAACLTAMLRITRAFEGEGAPPTLTALSAELDVPESALREWLDRLVEAGWLLQTQTVQGLAYVLAMSPGRIHAKDVLDALRLDSVRPQHTTTTTRREREGRGDFASPLRIDPEARRLWLELDAGLARSSANRTFQELVASRPAHTPTPMDRDADAAPAPAG